jgi:hypothetical protein
MLGTIGGSLAEEGRAASASVVLAVWAAAALKVIAAVFPLLAVSAQAPARPRWQRLLRALTWTEAVILTSTAWRLPRLACSSSPA